MNPAKATMTVTPPSDRPSREMIGGWLGLPADAAWPPDHYTLLGLPRGEADTARIEQRVQERLARVRSYQLVSPTAATEAMNLLAQAFCCLTDARAKQAYDAQLGVRPAPAPVTTHTALL